MKNIKLMPQTKTYQDNNGVLMFYITDKAMSGDDRNDLEGKSLLLISKRVHEILQEYNYTSGTFVHSLPYGR